MELNNISAQDLIIKLTSLKAEGAIELRTIESRMKVFCPFEAIGMVHQEIRHSNFLAYLLDPKRPHGLGTHFLDALIAELRATSPEIWQNGLYQNERLRFATIDRERMNIDLLIEIPGPVKAKSLVIAIEVKIHAGEGDEQLSRYESKLRSAYPASHWEHRLVFLTLDAREGGTAGTEEWQAISFDALLTRFDNAILANRLTGPCLDLYHDYQKMMRRHGMAQKDVDIELDAAVKRLWSEHREALEFLMERRPAPVQDLIRLLDQNRETFAEILSGKLGQTVYVDSDMSRWRRIAIPGLVDIDPRMGSGDKNWVKSGSMAVLELDPNGDTIVASIAINGSSSDPDFRIRLVEGLTKETQNKPIVPKPGVYHFWKQKLLSSNSINEAMDIESDPLDFLADQLAGRFRDNLDILARCAESAGSE